MTAPAISSFTARTVDGATLDCFEQGRGRPLLLITGLSGSSAFWTDIASTLARSFRVLRFDQRGIAGSERGSADCTIDVLARDSLAVLDAAGVDRAVVLGHSAGGCIAQSLARQVPERIDGLILSGTWLKPSLYMKRLFAARQKVLAFDPEAYATLSVLSAYPPAWIEANSRFYEAAMESAPTTDAAKSVMHERIDAMLAFDGSADIAALPMPVLVLGARDDMVVPAFHQEALASALPGCRKAIMETGGHLFPVSRPDIFTATVAEWVGALQ
ncbi:MAG: alpha/beta hydrolase [Chelatococcus sp.]|nr:MAG: alpha/beta hydrolase [Chelatococcus sp.]